MTVTQTVEIPTDRRLTIDVPREVPTGSVILSFTPVTGTTGGECPLCAKYRNPETGELRYNAETLAAFEEGDAILRGEIPTKRFNSLEEMLADLDLDSDD